MSLNINSVIFIIALSNLLNVIMFLAQYFLNKKYIGLGWWVTGFASISLSQFVALIYSKNQDIIFIFFADILLAMGFVVIAAGLKSFLRIPTRMKLLLSIFLITIISAISLFFHKNLVAEQGVLLAALSACCFIIAKDLYKKYKADKKYAPLFIAILFSFYCLLFTLQSFIDFMQFNKPANEVASILPVIYIMSFIMSTLATFSFLMLINQQLIEEQKKAERALQLNQQILLDAQSVANVGSYIHDIKTGNLERSWVTDKIFGIDNTYPKTFDSLLELITPVYRQDMKNYYHKFDAVQSFFKMDYIIERYADGEKRWIASMAKMEYDTAGNPLQVLGTIQDITDRKNAEQEIIESKNHFEILFNSSPDAALISALPAGNIIDINDSFKRISGFSKEEVVGKTVQEIGTWVNQKDRDKFLKEIAEKGYGSIAEVEFSKKNKEIRFCSLEGRVCTIKGKPHLISIIHDITERRLNEEKVKELHEQAKQRAEELLKTNDELEQFAYIASHDLQEPLRMVKSFLELVERKYDSLLDETGRKYIHFAVDGAVRMRQIINDLLEYSRVGKNEEHIEAIDMNVLLEELISTHQITIKEKNAVISYQQLPLVNSPRLPLQQVLDNLIGNALKYQQPDVAPVIEIFAEEQNDCWQIKVADNGIGIDPRFFHKIFIVFQRLHGNETYTGTGIGLAICKKIIEKQGGKIWVESILGKGSQFYFTIKK